MYLLLASPSEAAAYSLCEMKAKFVGCKIEDMRSRLCFFKSGHSGVPMNARGNISKKSKAR